LARPAMSALWPVASKASEYPSRTSAMASRALRNIGHSGQVSISGQSAQAPKCILLAHGANASGPSAIRMMALAAIFSGIRASRYPPYRPKRFLRMPWSLNSTRMASRNLRGISSANAISDVSVHAPAPYHRTRSTQARSAYFARLDSIEFQQMTDSKHKPSAALVKESSSGSAMGAIPRLGVGFTTGIDGQSVFMSNYCLLSQ